MRLARQRGVAVVTALLLTTLAVSIVASLFWQQQVQVRSMENTRLQLQTKWIVRGALDFARLVLRQNGFDQSGWTTLNDPWNTPVEETRLDEYVERERLQGESYDATLSGRIIDATSRYNLRNLTASQNEKLDEVAVFRQLLVNLQIDPALAPRAAKMLAQTQPPPPVPLGEEGKAPAPKQPTQYTLTSLDDLRAVEGFTPAVVDKLRDYVIVLPEPTPVNVNTADAPVLGAVNLAGLAEGNTLAAQRKTAFWRTKAEFPKNDRTKEDTYDVKSEYFLVRTRVKLDRATLETESLISRKLDGYKTTTVVWTRQI
jgi:general secretion pathway protein K